MELCTYHQTPSFPISGTPVTGILPNYRPQLTHTSIPFFSSTVKLWNSLLPL